jgi:hypothetical protein
VALNADLVALPKRKFIGRARDRLDQAWMASTTIGALNPLMRHSNGAPSKRTAQGCCSSSATSLNWSDTVTGATKRATIAVGVLADGTLESGDLVRQICGLDERVGPHPRHEFLFRDQVARPFHDPNEYVEARLPIRSGSSSCKRRDAGRTQNAPKRIEVVTDCRGAGHRRASCGSLTGPIDHDRRLKVQVCPTSSPPKCPTKTARVSGADYDFYERGATGRSRDTLRQAA